jgi:hypothetical protein
MKSPYLVAALLAFGVVGCTKTEVTPAPNTKVEVKPADTAVATPPVNTTSSSTTVVTPSTSPTDTTSSSSTTTTTTTSDTTKK